MLLFHAVNDVRNGSFFDILKLQEVGLLYKEKPSINYNEEIENLNCKGK